VLSILRPSFVGARARLGLVTLRKLHMANDRKGCVCLEMYFFFGYGWVYVCMTRGLILVNSLFVAGKSVCMSILSSLGEFYFAQAMLIACCLQECHEEKPINQI
jgi:hypothetical protein